MTSTQFKIIAALVLVLVALLLWRGLTKRNDSAGSPIDIDDLLLGDDGKLSKAAFVMMGAFAATTWVMVYMTLRDKMDAALLGVYVAAWVSPTVTRLITNRPHPKIVPAPATVETETKTTVIGLAVKPRGRK